MSTSPRSHTPADRIQFALAGRLGPLVVRSLCRTVRWTWSVHPETASWLDAGKPIIYAFWHGCLLPLTYTHKHLGIEVLVSQNKDGELIARVLHGLGFHTIRGSSSRQGTSALKALVRASRQGRTVGITPDGPRGPRHDVQDGVVFVAAMTGTPIVPLAADANPSWRLRSWDRFLIPKPFGKGSIVMGPLTYVPRSAASEPGTWRARIQSDIHAVTARARENVHD